jgi:peptide deformylase
VLDIVEYPDIALQRTCQRVSLDDLSTLRELVDGMAQAMYAFRGAGLAAPQAGASCRLLVMDHTGGEASNGLRALVNPEVTSRSREVEVGEEGCLSLPGVRIQVPRPVMVEVKYIGLDGQERTDAFTGWEGRIVQHEIDHLDGIMMIDRIGPLARKLALRNLLPRSR